MGPKKRGQWTEEKLQNAIRAVRSGTSFAKAAKATGIPRTTLMRIFKTVQGDNQIRKPKLGRKFVLTENQQAELCSRIFRLADVGMPITGKLLRRSIFTYAEKMGLKHKFSQKTQMAGRKWLVAFLKNNPLVAKRKSQTLNPGRAQKMNRTIVSDHFQKLQACLEELDIVNQPQQIYNMDEKGCRLTIHHQNYVLARKGAKRVHFIAPEHAENVTIVSCCNALGHTIPPMVLFKGKRMKQEWKDNMPPGTEVMMTPKGSMTTGIFCTWMDHFAKFKVEGPTLLVFDGASSHLDAEIVTKADEHNVTLYCLPSNTTHELQPLDKGIFKAFESYWDDEVLLHFTRHPDRQITRLRFGEIFRKVWHRSMTLSNITSGFQATGIFPFDPTIIPDEAFAPSDITEIPEPAAEEEENAPNLETATNVEALVNNIPSPIIDPPSSPARSFSMENSFTSLLSTPTVRRKKTQRRQAINSKGTKVVKSLFNKMPSEQSSKNPPPRKKSSKKPLPKNPKKPPQSRVSVGQIAGTSGLTSSAKESWYCFLCGIDDVADMRLCIKCDRYVHECVGLSAHDEEDFVCPSCED